ncbi:GPI inositol deacylase [Ceratobasidium sp. 428]|nr:GPI inositol deacylase [Ceratobasidium sp. 428]
MPLKSFWIISVIPVLWLLYQSHLTSLATLSPQGCRMSWMSPSYIVQHEFNTTWTPLARRYSLLLYREVGWDTEMPSGRPALFIPGNAGSSHQVRSIASSAARQFYSSPHVRSTDFASDVEPLDLYAVEFNEDLSALHGPTLQTQTAYVKSALEYIVSRYPQKHNLQVILLGHSMGGIVALNVLESQEHNAIVSAVITMSSPHSLPPARLDRDIERAFGTSLNVLWKFPSLNHSSGHTPPILALCGGATDNMLPMESCVLPPSPSQYSSSAKGLYRRTVFTSGLDGTWTGVGHREMVWCHQVRWRVARAALELAGAKPESRGAILDRWFAGVPDLSASRQRIIPTSAVSVIKVAESHFSLDRLQAGITTYHFPITDNRRRLTVMLARGRISGVAPEKEVLSEATVDVCEDSRRLGAVCKPMTARHIRLVPNPSAHEPFPVPGEGTDESEGVVVWEGATVEAHYGYFSLMVKSTGDGGSWLVVSLEPDDSIDIMYGTSQLAPVFGTEFVVPNDGGLVRRLWLRNLISHALVVYKAKFIHNGDCTNSLLAPILVHDSSGAECHFHRAVSSMGGAFLHSHNAGPFLGTRYGMNLTFYSSGECQVTKIQLSIDWRLSAGRAASRLWAGVFAYAVGIAAGMNALAWYSWDGSRQYPTLQQSFEQLVERFAITALVGVAILAVLPLPSSLILGFGGEPLFFALAPITLYVAGATVGCSCYLLDAIQWALGQVSRTSVIFVTSVDAETRRHSFTRSSMAFYAILAGLVIVFVPYQVAYLVAFILHLWSCSVMKTQLKRQSRDINLAPLHAQASHLLLLLFWLLPLIVPVLIVWARTLINAGITTPFDGDHNILNIAFIVMCVELGGNRPPTKSSSFYRNSLALSYLFLSLIAIVLGARYTYLLYLFFNVCCVCFLFGAVDSIEAVRGVSRR